MEKLIVVVSVTGAWGGKKQNPNHPTTPEEIAKSVIECWKAGAAVAHLHMRDEKENGSMDVATFEKTVKLIRESGCDIVLNLTTSGELGADDERRMAPFMKLKPEMCSLDAGTFNWGEAGVFLNTFPFLVELGKRTIEYGVKPEIECFDVSQIETAIRLVKKGVIKERPHFQLCLGIVGGMAATIENLVFMRNQLPANATWSAFGIGSAHLPILMASIAMGCDAVRVGFEDNFYRSRGVMFNSNAEQVERAIQIAKLANREIATPDEARKILELRPFSK
jgi:uncharacterized protein (DUF849 family)